MSSVLCVHACVCVCMCVRAMCVCIEASKMKAVGGAEKEEEAWPKRGGMAQKRRRGSREEPWPKIRGVAELSCSNGAPAALVNVPLA